MNLFLKKYLRDISESFVPGGQEINVSILVEYGVLDNKAKLLNKLLAINNENTIFQCGHCLFNAKLLRGNLC